MNFLTLRNRCLTQLFIIALTISIQSGAAVAHSGGTDANGCHAGSKPYHCHGSKSAPDEKFRLPPPPKQRKSKPSFQTYEGRDLEKSTAPITRTPSYGYVRKSRPSGSGGRYYFTRWPHRIEERRTIGFE
eukprot:GHVR01126949.1.p1 GENE.GHVR01126949.1~~GHVR01126949.1.p1  ORF type:complete len:130 (+),score=6.13 GHVR01126949.1:108-497(+)